MHLAQINIAHWAVDPESPEASEFVDNLYRINSLGENSPGFVWRLKDDVGTSALDVPTPWGTGIIANLTVWEDIESLRTFTYKSRHHYFIKNRKKWFRERDEAHMALWWISAGHIPSLEEAKERLDHFDAHGPTPYAFTFSKAFDALGEPLAKRPIRVVA